LRLHCESKIFERESQKWMVMMGKGKEKYVTIFKRAGVLSQHPLAIT